MRQVEKQKKPSKESALANKLIDSPFKLGQFTSAASPFVYNGSPLFCKTALPEVQKEMFHISYNLLGRPFN